LQTIENEKVKAMAGKVAALAKTTASAASSSTAHIARVAANSESLNKLSKVVKPEVVSAKFAKAAKVMSKPDQLAKKLAAAAISVQDTYKAAFDRTTGDLLY
jgi:hypothetical protein